MLTEEFLNIPVQGGCNCVTYNVSTDDVEGIRVAARVRRICLGDAVAGKFLKYFSHFKIFYPDFFILSGFFYSCIIRCIFGKILALLVRTYAKKMAYTLVACTAVHLKAPSMVLVEERCSEERRRRMAYRNE